MIMPSRPSALVIQEFKVKCECTASELSIGAVSRCKCAAMLLAPRQLDLVNFTCDLQSEDERGHQGENSCCLTDDVILTDRLKLSPRCFTTCSLIPATCKVHSCPDGVTLHETII